MKRITSAIVSLVIMLTIVLPGMNVMAAYATLPTISACESMHTVLLKNNGEVWAWGGNTDGQLGDGTTNSSNVPIKVNISGVKQIAAGEYHTIALKSNGEVWAWGWNYHGQIGNGSTAQIEKSPVKVDISDVKQLAAGCGYTLVLKNNGDVWGWGNGYGGVLGDEDEQQHNIPVKVMTIADVKQISAGPLHVVALKNNGEVWTWGSNSFFQLGVKGVNYYEYMPVKVDVPRAKQVSAGGVVSSVVTNNGEVWSWGYYLFGSVGNGKMKTQPTPVKLKISNVKQIICAYAFTYAIKQNGDVWCWGTNDRGQFGDGTTDNYYSPVDSGFNIYASTGSKPTSVKKDVRIEVRDFETNKLIPDAKISLFKSADDVKNYTLTQGKITLNNIGFPIYEIRAYANGYYYKPADLNVPYPNDGIIVFLLKPNYLCEVQGISILCDNKPQRTGGSLSLKVGEVRQLNAVLSPLNATDRHIRWYSSDSKVVTVDDNGMIKAINEGDAMISAYSPNDEAGFFSVTVFDEANYWTIYGYSFINGHANFGYDEHYKIPIERYLQAGYSYPYALLSHSFQKSWGGSCAGMSISSVLFNKDILKEHRYDQSAAFPREFSPPKTEEYNSKKLREMIELFQVAQKRNVVKYSNFSIDKVVSELDNGNPVVLGLHANVFLGHMVVIYSYVRNGDSYEFNIYDCSHYINKLICKKNFFGMEYKFDYKSNIYDWKIDKICTTNSLIDLYNDIYQKDQNNAISLFSLEKEQSEMYIICNSDNVVIQNSNGENSVIKDRVITGEIACMRLENQYDVSNSGDYVIIAPSDTYKVISSNNKNTIITFADDHMSVAINVENSVPVTVSADLHDIHIENEMDTGYSVTYKTYNNIFDEVTLSGQTNSDVQFTFDESNIAVSGVKSISAKVTRSNVPTEVAAEINPDQTVIVECSENDDGNAAFQLSTDQSELTGAAVLPERLKTESPQYDLPGGEYSEVQKLTFTYDDDTVIYYTTDGSVPSMDNGMIYSMPIEINQTVVINAIAVKYGYENSDVITLEYVLPEVSMPTASLESGNYTGIQQIELMVEKGADIYYTTDESDPIEDGVLYRFPIILEQNATIRICAKMNGCVSDVAEYNYAISNAKNCIIQNITAAEELVKVSIISDKSQKGILAVACYRDDGTLLGIKCHDVTMTANEPYIQMVEIDTTGASKISAFLWSDLRNLTPLASRKVITVIKE